MSRVSHGIRPLGILQSRDRLCSITTNGAFGRKRGIMDNTGQSPPPLLLQYARTANVTPVNYRYDPELEINIVTDLDGSTFPAVEGPDAGLLTKSSTVADGED
jgi:hypothetical protein